MSRIYMWIAFRLPKLLVYWCFMRVLAHATSGIYASTGVPSLTAINAIERWK